ncbi:MAG: DUF4129 domain-containing protein [Actinomycetota bacterium]|nr:DUF4129 domain-containing protein [Actinomycetota bacterium]
MLVLTVSLGGPVRAGSPVPAGRSRAVSSLADTRPVVVDLPIPRTDPARARQAADDVLARPAYRVPAPTLVERVQRWVSGVVEDVLGALVSGGGASLIAWGLLALAVGVVALLAARFARGVTPDGAMAASSASVPLRTATDWQAEAEVHEQAGRWRPALRCRYRALVADLAAGGLVDEVPGRTAGEYRAAVGMAAPAVAPEFAAATELFERAWYGRAPTGADDAARLSSLADRVLAGAR